MREHVLFVIKHYVLSTYLIDVDLRQLLGVAYRGAFYYVTCMLGLLCFHVCVFFFSGHHTAFTVCMFSGPLTAFKVCIQYSGHPTAFKAVFQPLVQT